MRRSAILWLDPGIQLGASQVEKQQLIAVRIFRLGFPAFFSSRRKATWEWRRKRQDLGCPSSFDFSASPAT